MLQANAYEIDDESKIIRDSDAVMMKKQYEKGIEEIMTEKLKNPDALMDTENISATGSSKPGKSSHDKSGTSNNTMNKSSRISKGSRSKVHD